MRISKVEATRIASRQLFENGAVQLLLYLLAVLLPALALFGATPRELLQPTGANSMLAVTTAAALSWLVLRRLRRYANSRRLSYVLPVHFFTFGLAAGIVGVLRVPYSVVIFSLVFASTTLLSYVLLAMSHRLQPVQLIVPGGKVEQLAEVSPEVLYVSREIFAQISQLGRSLGPIGADLHFDHSPETERMIAEAALAGIPVYDCKSLVEAATGQVRVDHLSETNRGSLIPNLSYMLAKRAIDVLASLALLPLLLPAFAVIACLIKLESRGTVFFHQERVGFRGKLFRIHKFRTMRPRSPGTVKCARTEEMTQDDDERITRVGRVLRRYRLDELPQIFNILRGEMSWIGPRPEAINLSLWYAERIPFYSYRHIVRPGLTGWAQVNQGHVIGLDDIGEKLRFDFYYIKNFSHWLDILIVLKSIRVILFGNGAK